MEHDKVLENNKQNVKTEALLIPIFVYIMRITSYRRTLTRKTRFFFQGGHPILLYTIINVEIFPPTQLLYFDV